MSRYNPKELEAKWQKKWQSDKTFQVDLEKAEKPFYNLMMFPYPSGEGLHVGHVYAFGGSDTFGHFKKMQGYDVFEPMGFDSFGIHSENYAIKIGKHPRELIEETTKYFKEEQLDKLGALFDWSKSVTTSEASYYKWTQWLFIQLFKAGLAVRKKSSVDWCPSCLTVLADEQVIAGKCERCGTEVIQKELEQWFFKITDYAQRLLDNLEKIDWSETTKTMQRNWIGRSEGAEIIFKLRDVPGQEDDKHSVTVYTTRPDTIFGATFLVISPETVKSWLDIGFLAKDEVKKYVDESLNKTEVSRLAEGKDKTGVDTEIKAVHPLTGELLSVWVADYVLGSYGTGAIMAVPGHDQRDYDFAKKFGLPIVEVISGGDVKKEAWQGEGKLVNSEKFNGQSVEEAKINLSKYIEEKNSGSKKVNFHLRDWLVSRQRYWGPPIPMIYCESCAKDKKGEQEGMSGWYSVPEKDLPVELPYVEDYQPRGSGVSPLASVPSFLSVKCPGCGKDAKRETDVSDTFLDSSWYFLRYPSVGDDEVAFEPEVTKKWLPVNQYIGGNEHAVLHLLYTRFITMALSDLKLINFEEPFDKFRAHGLIIYKGAKMSKSRGNVVNPNEYMQAYGADTLKMYLLFIGPYELGGEFDDRAITGVYRFLNRVWTLVEGLEEVKESNKELETKLNSLIKKVSDDLENLRFNTAIAALMEFLNLVYKHQSNLSREIVLNYLKLLAPFAPFISEELWEKLGEKGSIHQQSWPEVGKVVEETSWQIVVQVNGKFRGKVEVAKDSSEDQVSQEAQKIPSVEKDLQDKQISNKVWVKGKLINFVAD
ncbi:MAG TPA: leucine--tRNA ligase [Candidatus Saccharimonadales bacterium]|nr:leucine--tRNA ligase [Candidatus Saccharimonadales bacterium]